MKTLAIIPARYASTRFPGKPLTRIGDKTMIQRVYEQTGKSSLVDAVIVATDDDRIFSNVVNFKGNVIMTDAKHPSGTDRCAEVARQVTDYELIINIQGDEPFIDPTQIDIVIELLKKGASIATLAKKIEKQEALFSVNVVKVEFNEQQNALNFSRKPIPEVKDQPQSQWLKHGDFFKHIGLYGFQRETLLNITALAPSAREKAESLEQLRWLENNYAIAVGLTDKETISIDSPEDLLKVKL
ncbi:MAG: 3-deoxy-manno-octulosonate cytidylyltransferase [Saprospiraceae bacterium]|nr:3-deoxy-manno-octulosonate cytidylyltransferase [Saprospiraceae bacterium]